MYFKLKLFAVSILIALSATAQSKDDTSDDENDNAVDKSKTQLNFVIFLTEPDVSCAQKIHEDKNLFCFKKNILPCTDKYLKGMPRELVKYARLRNVSCDCEKILKNSIKSLLQWAEVSKQMTTGSVSLQEKSESEEMVIKPTNRNVLREIFPRKRRHMRHKRSIYLMPNSETDNKEDLIYLPLPKNEKGKTDIPILKIINSKDIPMYHAFPRKKGIRFNGYNNFGMNKLFDMNAFERPDQRRSNKVRKCPKHTKKIFRFFKDISTEVPKDTQETEEPCTNSTTEVTTESTTECEPDSTTSGTTEVNEELEEVSTTCSTVETDSNDIEETTEESDNNEEGKNGPGNIWEMLKLMESIKSSYFQGFFQPLWGISNTTQPTLQNITKTMLEQLKNVSQNHGFIAVITGGKLSELNSTSSDLSETLKSIKNRCNENRTVIIVTGYCPNKKKKKCNAVNRPEKIPMFISGVYSDRFHDAKELYDIPHIIRDILKEEAQNLEKKEEEDKSGLARFFSNDGEMKLAETLIDQTYSGFDEDIPPVKYKRSIFTRELENNSETFVYPRLLLSLFCFVIVHEIF